MPRILLANFHNKGYGQPTAVFLLARALHEAGHAVTVACPAGSVLAQRSSEAGIPVFTGAAFRALKHLRSTARDVAALRRYLREQPPDIIHTNGSQDTWAFALARVGMGPRIPLVMSRHNSKVVHEGWSNRWLYGSAIDHLILTSAAIRDQYVPLLERGVLHESGMSVIHPPFDLSQFEQERDRTRLHRELNLRPDIPVLGIVGRLNADKGHRILLRALPAILARHPDCHTIFAGSGELLAALREEIRAMGLEQRVSLLGFRSDIADVTSCLTISVLPTTGTDSSPTVLKEALCLRVPVVAADTGGVSEVIDHGVTGLVVPRHDHVALGQAIIDLLDDPARARSMASAGADRVRTHFAPAPCAEHHGRLYEQILQRRAPRKAMAAG